jgi:hypothetical protein
MSGERIMAGRLLSVAVAAVLVHGCLLPQDDQVFDDLPPRRNIAPRIVQDQAKPGAVTAIDLELGPNCRRPSFSVVVEDLDLADRIRNKWFVDPDQAFSTVNFSTNPLNQSETSIRNTPFTAPTQLFSAGSKLAEPGQHFLTVVIADGEFEGGGIATLGRSHVIPDGDGGTRVVIDPSHTDQFTWVINTTLSPCADLP